VATVKIYATSDLHGNRAIIDKLRDVEDDCDLILIGDIGGKNHRGAYASGFLW
jgi:Icc-related predicted phosphoesterase